MSQGIDVILVSESYVIFTAQFLFPTHQVLYLMSVSKALILILTGLCCSCNVAEKKVSYYQQFKNFK